MEQNKVNLYMSQYGDKVPQDKKIILKNALAKANDNAEENLSVVKLHNPLLVVIISIFFGVFGVDRFMLGDIGVGVCKLLFGWLTLGIWPLIDIFTCHKRAKEKNLQNILISLD